MSVFNLMNAILGSGILGLSYAMAQLGIVLFTLICGGVAVLALYAIILLLRMCKITGANVSFPRVLTSPESPDSICQDIIFEYRWSKMVTNEQCNYDILIRINLTIY